MLHNKMFRSLYLLIVILTRLSPLRADWPSDEWIPDIDDDSSLLNNDNDDDASYEPQALVSDRNNSRSLILCLSLLCSGYFHSLSILYLLPEKELYYSNRLFFYSFLFRKQYSWLRWPTSDRTERL